jgi:tRNA(Ile)-lysidine synthase
LLDTNFFSQNLATLISCDSTQIAIAVSGGADSMCLALIMKNLKRPVVCIIIDHGLRIESAAEALKTANFLTDKGLKTEIITWQKYRPENKKISNLHQKARDIRYELLLNYCKNNDIAYLMTGHHKNDQAETVLLRIARGTGIDGITAIKAKSLRQGINIIRPLLPFTRSSIEKYLEQYNWQWINDPSNDNTDYARSRIRNMLKNASDHGLTIDRIDLLRKNAARASDYLKQQTILHYKEICNRDEFGTILLNIRDFLALHEEMKLRILSKILCVVTGAIHSPRLNALMKLSDMIGRNWSNQTIQGAEVLKYSENELLFIREHRAIPQAIEIDGPAKLVWDNRFIIELKLKSRVTIKPLDLITWQQIKKSCHTHFRNYKVRYTLPMIVVIEEHIVNCFCPLLAKSDFWIVRAL